MSLSASKFRTISCGYKHEDVWCDPSERGRSLFHYPLAPIRQNKLSLEWQGYLLFSTGGPVASSCSSSSWPFFFPRGIFSFFFLFSAFFLFYLIFLAAQTWFDDDGTKNQRYAMVSRDDRIKVKCLSKSGRNKSLTEFNVPVFVLLITKLAQAVKTMRNQFW